MFISTKRAGYERGGQVASGRFPMLLSPDPSDPDTPEEFRDFMRFDYIHQTRAIVRFVSMKQLGHFMMGTVRVLGVKLSVSGPYGNDGLVMTVPWKVYQAGVPVPPELMQAWQSVTEAEAMREWAKSIDTGK